MKIKLTSIIISICVLLSACKAIPLVSASSAIEKEKLSPEETVEAFYKWYIEYSGTPENSTFKSPLSDKAYRESEYLSPTFIHFIDTFMTLPPEQANYDPILCAQNIPANIFVEASYQTEENMRVLVGDDFAGYHRFTVDLVDQEGQWLINNVVCVMSPEGTAQAFYTWYLGSVGAPGSEDFHNLLVDGIYRESDFLSESYINKVDELVASFEHGGYDPFLMAQDLPREFSVESGSDEMNALVHLYFGTETIHTLILSFTQEKGWLQIINIKEADSPEPKDQTTSNTQDFRVAGWLGHVSSLPAGSQYDDKLVLEPEGTGELGIIGMTDKLEAEIVSLRDKEPPGKYAHFWGTLDCDIPDVNGCRLAVSRVRYGASATEGDMVEAWEGTLTNGIFNGGVSKVFILKGLHPMQYSIDSVDADIKNQLEAMAGSGVDIRVWGELLTGVPDVNGSRIQVTHMEVIGDMGRAKPTSDITPIDPKTDWQTYSNPMFAYQIRYPENAALKELPIISFDSSELPEGMDPAEYMTQLEAKYGSSLCIQITYSLGYLTISAAPNTGNRYVTCGMSGTAAGDLEGISETVYIDGEEKTARGYHIKGSSDALDQNGEVLWIEMDDGTRLEFGSLPESSATFTDYQMKGANMIRDIAGTFIFTK